MTKYSQLALIDGQGITEAGIMDAVDVVVSKLYQTNDLHQVTNVLGTLDTIGELAGKAKARLLFGIHQWWLEYGEGDFEDYIRTRTSLSSTTAQRYITVQTYLRSGEIPEDVAVRPLRDLVPIAKTLSHGHTITRSQFNKIAKATSTREIEDVLRGVKNKPPRKNSLQIYWKKDGTIEAWKDNQPHFCGFLDKEAYETDPVVKQAIDRLIDDKVLKK